MADGIVKIGTWYDYEEEGIWGWNFTVTSQQATVITALLALGLQTTGIRSWKIIRYILHHRRRHDLPRDAMIRQQEVLLRNEGSDIGAVFGLTSLLWAWRTFGSLVPGDILKSTRLSTWRVLGLGLAHWFCFLFLATWLPLTLSKGKPNPLVLLEDINCVLPLGKSSIFNSGLIGNEMPSRTASSVARWYYDTCYHEGGYAVDCNRFSNRKITWSEAQEGIKCPFGRDACVNKTQPISFDTGHISPMLFGKNTKKALDATIRRRTTCSPLRPETFATNPPNAIQGYHYFNFSTESEPIITLVSGGTPLNVHIGPSSRNDYEFIAVARTGWTSGLITERPFIHPALNRSDAEVVIGLINKENVKYRAEVDDIIFAAHTTRENFKNLSGAWYNVPNNEGYTPEDFIMQDTEEDTWYHPDAPVSMIGCADQFEICQVSSNNCSGLLPIPPPALRALFLFFWMEGKGIKLELSATGADIIFHGGIMSNLREVGPEALNVRRYGLGFGDGKQNAPRHKLWENEARSWFGASIARMQFAAVQETALFLLPEKRLGYKKALAASKGNYSSGKDCWTIKVRSSEHETLSLFGILLLLSICALLFGVSNLDGLMQRNCFRKRPHQVLAWELDASQQLVRQLHQLIKPTIFHPTAIDETPIAVGTTGTPRLRRENGSQWTASFARNEDRSNASQTTLSNIARTMTEAEKVQLIGAGWENIVLKLPARWIWNNVGTVCRLLRMWKVAAQRKINSILPTRAQQLYIPLTNIPRQCPP